MILSPWRQQRDDTIIMNILVLLSLLVPQAVLYHTATALSVIPTLSNHAPPWATLEERVYATGSGRRLQQQLEGDGNAHIKAKQRRFDSDDKIIRVKLYRDSAAWCPYCQRVWLLLEEERIPYHQA